jgi:hypothetical protein
MSKEELVTRIVDAIGACNIGSSLEDQARAALTVVMQSQPEARLREALEIVAGGDVDVSDTAIIVGNGASTVMRQIHAALSNEGNG